MYGTDGLPIRRRSAFRLGGLAVLALAGCESTGDTPAPAAVLVQPTTATEALARLTAGNERFAAGHPEHPEQSPERRAAEVSSQNPFALILSCVDSRMPPEIVFDQGLGDLFVARSAGEVLDDAVTGSIEYGVKALKTPLVAVLGHQDCGAVKSTIEAVEGKAQPTGTDIDVIVNAIKPAVVRAQNEHAADLQLASTKYNVEDIVGQLKTNPVLAAAVATGALQITGGYYDISSGRITFFG